MQSADTVLGVLRERDRRHGVITGEPDARKRASPVRREAARKRTRPAGPSPCGPPSSSPGGLGNTGLDLDPWIGDCLQQIDEGVDHDVQSAEYKGDGGDSGEVRGGNRLC